MQQLFADVVTNLDIRHAKTCSEQDDLEGSVYYYQQVSLSCHTGKLKMIARNRQMHQLRFAIIAKMLSQSFYGNEPSSILDYQ